MIAVYPDADALAQAAADLFVCEFRKRIAESSYSGRFSVVLSGGMTPRQTYECLAKEPFKSQVEWKSIHVFWGDERCVPPDDFRSNFRMTNEALLAHVPIPPEQIYPIRFDNDPNRSARDYEALLRRYFGTSSRCFDFAFFGLGQDGHTASLFPESPVLNESERWAVALRNHNEDFDRVTLTLPLLNSTHLGVFLVRGEGKAEILKKVISCAEGSPRIPASLIQPTNGQLRWLVDAGAYQYLFSSLNGVVSVQKLHSMLLN